MWKLIRLEWKKNNTKRYIMSACIMIAILALFLFAQCYLGIANDPDIGVPDATSGMNNMAVQIELLCNISFMVFTSVMLSVFVNAFKDKTQRLMFCYPIKRQKIVLSQMMAVWIFCIIFLICGKLLIYMLLVAAFGLKASFPLGYDMKSIDFYIQTLLKSILTVTLGFIPLYIGKLMNSSKIVIISSMLLITIMDGTVGSFTLRNLPFLPIALFGISLICVYLMVCNIENEDIE